MIFHLRFFILVPVLLLFATTGIAQPAGCVNYEDYLHRVGGVGERPEGTRRVSVSGTYAYLGRNFGFEVIDIADPLNPTVVGEVDVPGAAVDVAVSGVYAYVAGDTSGFHVLDITSPTSPAIVGSMDIPGYSYAQGVAISGAYAYVAYYSFEGSGLQVIDITNPMSPAIVGSVDTPGSAQGVAIDGSHAYVADGDSGLQVIDITNSALPTIEGSVDTPNWATDVAISGSHAYVGDEYSLRVIDITNPMSPTIVGSVATTGLVRDIAISGAYAYVADLTGLQVIDVTNPASPAILGSVSGYDYGIAVSGGHAYATDYFNGLQVIDITNPTSVTPVGGVDTPGNGQGVAVSDSYAYLSDPGFFAVTNFRVIDITDPASPILMGGVDVPGDPRRLEVSNSYAYVAAGNSGLQIIDVTNSTSPTVAADVDTLGHAYDLVLSGPLVYVATDRGLRVVDVQFPTAPVSLGLASTPGATAVAILGSHAYVATFDSSMDVVVIDIADPALPVILGSVSIPGYASQGLAVTGTTVYVGGGTSVYVIDASNPTLPAVIGSVGTFNSVHDIVVSGDFAYVAAGTEVQVLDIRDPASPVAVGQLKTPGDALDIAVFGSVLGVANEDFLVLPAPCSVTPVRLSSFFASPRPGAIQLTWATSEESDFAGFHVYRSRWPDRGYEQRSSRLIVPPSPYGFLDDAVTPGITYYYRLEALDRSGTSERFGPVAAEATAQRLTLGPGYPNPFAVDGATIPLTLARDGDVTLRIVDLAGRQVRLLVNSRLDAGERNLFWDGRNDRGEAVAAGVYLYELEGPGFREARRLVKLR